MSHAAADAEPSDAHATAPGTTTAAHPESDSASEAGSANRSVRGGRDEPLSLGDHLEELRFVLIKGLIALVVGILLCLAIFGDDLFVVFVAPLEMDSIVLNRPPRIPAATIDEDGKASHVLVTIDVLERFKALLFVAIIGGIFFAGPYILWQVWAFVRVGLYPRERRVFYVLLPAAGLLFAAGVSFGYFIMLPVVVDFMLNLGGQQFDEALRTELRLSNYLTYFVVMTLVVGLIFQIPVVMTILARISDINPARMRKLRKYVVVLALGLGMIFTPPDPITQIMLAVPVLFLFELGLVCSDWAHGVRMREHEAIMAEPDPWEEMWNEQDEGFDDPDQERNGEGGNGGDGNVPPTSGGGATTATATSTSSEASETVTASGEATAETASADASVRSAAATTSAPPPVSGDAQASEAATNSEESNEAERSEEDFEVGPVARSTGFVTWRANRSEPSEDEQGHPEASQEGSQGEEGATPEAPGAASDNEASTSAAPDEQGHDPTSPPISTAPSARPLTEGDVLELIDMRVQHYLREELPGEMREWIAEEVRRQLQERNNPHD